MKNKLLSLVLATMMVFTMVGCGSSASNIEVSLPEAMDEFKSTLVEGESVVTQALDAELIEQFYAITPDMYTSIEAHMPMMSGVQDEYVFVEVAEGQLDAVVAAFEARQAFMVSPTSMNYPETIEFAENYKLETFADKYVVFAIGFSAEDITAHFAEYFN